MFWNILRFGSKIGSDNGLSPGQRQAILWTNTGPVYVLRTISKIIKSFIIDLNNLNPYKALPLMPPGSLHAPGGVQVSFMQPYVF